MECSCLLFLRNAINTQPNSVMFYFDSLEKLRDFESFRVEAANVFHDPKEKYPTRYSVIGKIRSDIQFPYPEFLVADVDNESYAKLFADLCKQYIKD